ncbi:PilN domain-containing protein [Candidatus Omnitrophota bacterium]
MRQVNLLPELFQHEMRIKTVKKSLVLSAVVLLLIIVPVHVLFSLKIGALRAEKQNLLENKDIPSINALREESQELKMRTAGVVNDNRTLLEISGDSLAYKEMLKHIGDITLNKVWINSLTISKNKKTVEISGRSFDAQLVSEFLLELKSLECFNDVDLTSMQSKESQGGSEVTFGLTCEFD